MSEFKDNWIKALRSGEYQQGQFSLAIIQEDSPEIVSYCCLGVAAKINNDLDNDGWSIMYESTNVYYGPNNELSKPILALNEENIASRCMSWNDQEKMSFNEIADRLEDIDF